MLRVQRVGRPGLVCILVLGFVWFSCSVLWHVTLAPIIRTLLSVAMGYIQQMAWEFEADSKRCTSSVRPKPGNPFRREFQL